MKHSISDKALIGFGILFWIIIWQIASMIIDEEILLVSPCVVLSTLSQIMLEADFWKRIAVSFVKIIGGFALGAVFGSLLGAASHRSRVVYALASPVNQMIKSTPIASFIILILFWVRSANISVIISFLIVFPVFYSNLLEAVRSFDKNLNEMALVYNMSFKNRLLYIYLPQIMPYFISACSVGLGMCWKAGIAAEVIATPDHSIGDILYRSKINVDTPMLFAWTAAVIIISVVFEKLFIFMVKNINKRFYHDGEKI